MAWKEDEKLEQYSYVLNKLYELKIKAEIEDRQRGKKRYVSKVSAYQDLINLIEQHCYLHGKR